MNECEYDVSGKLIDHIGKKMRDENQNVMDQSIIRFYFIISNQLRINNLVIFAFGGHPYFSTAK